MISREHYAYILEALVAIGFSVNKKGVWTEDILREPA